MTSIDSTKTMAAHDFNVMLATDSYKVGEQVLDVPFFVMVSYISGTE